MAAPQRRHPAFLDVGLAGAWVVRALDRGGLDALIRTAIAEFRGGDLGGLDLMPPNEVGESWVFVGRWTDCRDAAVQTAIRELERALQVAAELVRNGLFARGGGRLELRSPAESTALTVTPYEYAVGIAPVQWWTWTQDQLRPMSEILFPSMRGWIGVHMGMPHWLGVGMDRDGEAIRSFTPYARLAMVADRGIEIAAMAEPEELDAWLADLQRVTGWW